MPDAGKKHEGTMEYAPVDMHCVRCFSLPQPRWRRQVLHRR